MARDLIVTPQAPCQWAKVLEPTGYPAFDESKPNEWSIQLVFDPAERDHAEFLALAEDLFEKNHPGEKKGRYWWPGNEGEDEDKGKMVIRFKSVARVFKDGKSVKPPQVLDKDNKPWDAEKLIGNGSIVRVAFNVYAWKSPGIGAGMTFQPQFVQVVKHTPYTAKDGGTVGGNPFSTTSSPFN